MLFLQNVFLASILFLINYFVKKASNKNNIITELIYLLKIKLPYPLYYGKDLQPLETD